MTQQYFGRKIVTAWEEEKDGKPGYAVKYADGYISWSPKDAFEAANIEIGHVQHLPEFHQRLIAELAVLRIDLGKLEAFYQSDARKALGPKAQDLLNRQLDLITDLGAVLEDRLELLVVPE